MRRMICRSVPQVDGLLAKLVSGEMKTGVGAVANAQPSGLAHAAGYLAGGVFLVGGIIAGLKGNFLVGGVSVVLAPIIGHVVGNYASGGDGY